MFLFCFMFISFLKVVFPFFLLFILVNASHGKGLSLPMALSTVQSPFAAGVMAKTEFHVLNPLMSSALAKEQAQCMLIERTVLTLPLKTLEGLQQSSKEEKLDFLLKRCTDSASHTHVVANILGLCPRHLSKQIFLKEA